MSNDIKKATMNIALMSVITSSMCETPYRKNYELAAERPKGYEPKGKSDDELARHKAHRKQLQAKRNARKGVYANKIKYPKKRK